MKILVQLIVLIFLQASIGAQNINIQLLGQKPYPSSVLHGELNDVWGHVDSLGNEYAIVGLEKGVSIVDVDDPTNLTEVFYVSGPSTIWRDMKTWNNHAYITNEYSGGLMIIDLDALPGTITPADVYYFTGSSYPFNSAHNIYIDENGIAYIFGSDYGNGGAIMLDLTVNPKAPVEVGLFDTEYLHDGMARGDTLWGAAVYKGAFYVINVSNKANPLILASKFTSGFFAHNCWISDDGNTLFTTDEIANGAIGSYDVSDVSNIDELDVIYSNPGSGVIPHNTHVYGDFLVTSYYRDGVTVVDASNPDRLVQTGNYDTSPFNGTGFNGCWGTYPYLPSGKLLATDIENGLFVLGVNYTKGVYLKGNSRKFSDSTAVALTEVTVVNGNNVFSSNLNGFYKESFADSGWYKLAFYKPGYLRDTIDIYMQSGQSYTVDVYLRKQIPFTLKGIVLDGDNQSVIPFSKVLVKDNDLLHYTFADANGAFEITNFFEGHYEVTTGLWPEYKNSCIDIPISGGDSLVLSTYKELNDDFTFDNFWTADTKGTSGAWERELLMFEPSFHTLDFPIKDVNNDCSDFAYVTGVSGASDHDVDGGLNVLISPQLDLTSFEYPLLSFSYWFRNDAPGGVDDTLTFSIAGSGDTVDLLKIHNAINLFQSKWIDTSLLLINLNMDLSDVYFIASAGDFGPDNLLEAGLDNFRIGEAFVGIADQKESAYSIEVFPNPFSDVINLRYSANFKSLDYQLTDIAGRMILKGILYENINQIQIPSVVPNGIYILRLSDQNGNTVSRKMVKTEL